MDNESKQPPPETDGWDASAKENPKVRRIHRIFLLATGLIICASVITYYTKIKDRHSRRSTNHTSAKAACGTVCTEVITAKNNLSHLPTYNELSQYLDAGVYFNMHLPDTSAFDINKMTGYKRYRFVYLTTTATGTLHPTARAVFAYPINYGTRISCSHLISCRITNCYYRRSDMKKTLQADFKNRSIPNHVLENIELKSSTWK